MISPRGNINSRLQENFLLVFPKYVEVILMRLLHDPIVTKLDFSIQQDDFIETVPDKFLGDTQCQ